MHSFLKILPACIMVLLPSVSDAQAPDTVVDASGVFKVRIDSTTGLPVVSVRAHAGTRQTIIISRGDVLYASFTLQQSYTENLILELESSELNALKKRDHSSLQRLWARDYTLDKSQPRVVNGLNALPFYATLSRLIERITIIDSTSVFTSGYECSSELESAIEISAIAVKPYFHAWTKKYGIWKLTTKR